MRARHFVSWLLLILAAWVSPVCAFIDPPYITPANPTSDDTISVNVFRGECDVLNIGIVPPIIEQNGSNIAALFTGIHEDDPEWCYYSIGTETVPIGRYPDGSYTLRVDRRYGTPFGTWAQETLGVIPFTVTGVPPAQPISAPTLSVTGLAGLLLVMISAALRAMRRRARPLC